MPATDIEMNGIRPVPQDISQNEKKKRNYKLLVDPVLKKGNEKVYRYDGIVPGHETLYPPVQIRDPRSRLAMLWTRSEAADLTVPRFKIDGSYVGTPPAVQVTIFNLNDNINKVFLDDLLKKYGPIENSHIYYHPKTRKHLRLAHITFTSPQSARKCVEKLNNTSVMGDILKVYLDPFAKDCNRIFDDVIVGRTLIIPAVDEQTPTVQETRTTIDPRLRTSLDKDNSCSEVPARVPEVSHPQSCDYSTPSTDLGYGSELGNSLHLEGSQSVQSSISDFSSYSISGTFGTTPYNYGSYDNCKLSSQKSYMWDKRSHWDSNGSPSVSHIPKRQSTPPSPGFMPKQSFVRERESLDSRIALLLKQSEAKNSFPGLSAVANKLGEIANEVQNNKIKTSPSWSETMPPLPPDACPLPPLPEGEAPPPPPPEDEDDHEGFLSTPPSPFNSVAEYHKWASYTKDTDRGRTAKLPLSDNQDDQSVGETILSRVRLTNIHWNSKNDGSYYDPNVSPISLGKGDCTPVRDELPDNYSHTKNHEDDDDKMSLSSLSSGEDKLELNIPHASSNHGSQETENFAQTLLLESDFNSVYSQPVTPTKYSELSSAVFQSYTSSSTISTYSQQTSTATMYPAASSNQFSSQTHVHPVVASAGSSGQPIPSLVSSTGMRYCHPDSPSHGPTSHPMYPSEQVQMMARMGIWRPGMGSASFLSSPTKCTNTSVPQAFSCSNYSPESHKLYATVNHTYSPSAFNVMFSRPPPGYPYIHSQKNKHGPPSHFVHQLTRIPLSKDDPKLIAINGVLDTIVKELKQVMKKDICKKMIEVSAFKCFEKWWDDHQCQTKEEKPGEETKPTISKLPTYSSLNALFDSNVKTSPFDSMGIGLGLRATMPRMPSFRRKIKMPSPPRLDDDEDSKKAEDSDVEKDKSDSDSETFVQLRKTPVNEDEQSTQESDSEESEGESGSEESGGDSSGSEESDSEYDDSEIESDVDEDADMDICTTSPKVTDDALSDAADALSSVFNEVEKIHERQKDKAEQKVDSRSPECKLDDTVAKETSISKDQQTALKEVQSTEVTKVVESTELPKTSDSGVPLPCSEDAVRNDSNSDLANVVMTSENQKKTTNEDSRTIEASHALMALASSFTDFRTNSTEQVQNLASSPVSKKKKVLKNTTVSDRRQLADSAKFPDDEVMYISETTLSADETLQFEDDYDSDKYESFSRPPEGEELALASQLIMEHSYSLPPNFGARVQDSIDAAQSIPDSVSESPKKIGDHEYTKTLSSSPAKSLAQHTAITTPRRRTRKRKYSSFENDEPYIVEEVPKKAKVLFAKRSLVEEMNVLYEFLKSGIDLEDVEYAHRSYDAMLQDDTQGYWLNDTHWVDHPPSNIPPPPLKKKKKEESARTHLSGCARCEGYYKMDLKEKAVFRHGAVSGSVDDSEVFDMSKVKTTSQMNREARSNQRRLLTAFCEKETFTSPLLQFNQLMYRKKMLKFARSTIHDWGLFALEPIAENEMVIEYVGQMVRPIIADRRESKYTSLGVGSSYLFKVDVDSIIDATRCGNLARFINHSCNPNCYAKIISFDGVKKIVIYSKQPISVNEEITYDYKFPLEDEKITCLCGAPQCRGTLN